jgi:hypothetical protein
MQRTILRENPNAKRVAPQLSEVKKGAESSLNDNRMQHESCGEIAFQ